MPKIAAAAVAPVELVERYDRRFRRIEEKIAKQRQELRAVRRDARAAGVDMLAFDLQRRLAKLGVQREAAFVRAFTIYRTQLSLDLEPHPPIADGIEAAARACLAGRAADVAL